MIEFVPSKAHKDHHQGPLRRQWITLFTNPDEKVDDFRREAGWYFYFLILA